jgi:hypothetical protein
MYCVHSTGYSSNEFIFNASKFTLQYPYPSVKYNIYMYVYLSVIYLYFTFYQHWYYILHVHYFPPFKLVN